MALLLLILCLHQGNDIVPFLPQKLNYYFKRIARIFKIGVWTPACRSAIRSKDDLLAITVLDQFLSVAVADAASVGVLGGRR
ncbi:MAG: hypothetical protein EXS05_06195 [Planctomycetaceae bacterium]|nr:hypothetical protein [Planctomycetaceae bacterium]